MSQDVAILIPTCNRPQLLVERALRSVSLQSIRPDVVVIVNDGTEVDASRVRAACAGIDALVARNERRRGAAGAWNHGLDLLWREGFRGYVALLDDDDEWDSDHLEVNLNAAIANRANVVVSGLRLHMPGGSGTRAFIDRLRDRDFLVGNPGWQGSNTFVAIELLRRVGGFREDLASLNDRDLAIRLLRCPETRATLVHRWTATWHLGTPGSLSAKRGPAKIAGLRMFWRIYGDEMNADEVRAYFARALNVFRVTEAEIRSGDDGWTPRFRDRGDLELDAEEQL